MGGAIQPVDRHAGLTTKEGRVAPGPRDAAFLILADVRRGHFADRSAALRLADLDDADRALARELAFGTIRLRGRLDAELAVLVSRPLSRIDPAVHDWLRLGLYQLRNTRIPDHAAVDQTVESVKRVAGSGAGGLANAVLRRAAREGTPAGAFPDEREDPAGYLATWGSHPRWLVDRWLGRWPLASVRRLVENDNRAPEVTVRPMDRAIDPGAEVPEVPGVRLEPLAEWPGLFRLESGSPAEALRGVQAVVQDPAAAAVVDYAGGELSGPIVDLCAAPGGKAVGLAAANPGARPFVAADVNAKRLDRLRATVTRVGSDVAIVRMDGRMPAVSHAGTVLLDAPCTGTGVLRRRPDARWRLTPAGLEALGMLQTELLDSAAAITAPGGLVIYATCSLEPEENEGQVEAFLTRHANFRREPPETGAVAEGLVDEQGDLRVLPFMWGTDGAYACRLRKIDVGGG